MTERNKLTIEELRSITKLHVLLRIGLDDLKKFEQLPDCHVSMSDWLVTSRGECHACLAGVVLHQGLGLVNDYDINDNWLFVLNNLRGGQVDIACARLVNADIIPLVPNRHIVDYARDKTGWWSGMEQLYDELKAADL